MNIIKINHLEKDIIKKIYVFKGLFDVTDDYLVNGDRIFSENEMENIISKNIPIELVNELIHYDDTISTIKKKIIKYTQMRISTFELYLFGVKQMILNASTLYNQLTQMDTIPLTRERLCEFMLNIVPGDCEDSANTQTCSFADSEKEIFNFEDFINIDDFNWDIITNITIPIGQKLSQKKLYHYTVNPYNILFMNSTLKRKSSEMLTTQNNNLLFEYSELCNNNIFIALANEVLEYSKEIDNISEEDFLKLYFPQLSIQKQVTSLELLNDKKIQLYDETSSQLNETFDDYNKRIDLLYNMYYKKTSDIPYENNTPGVLKLEFTIHPTYSIKFPLEILFKLINSNKTIPMIKYNPGKSRENIYRLFTNYQYATNGKNIPFLYSKNKNKKSKIIQISKILAKKKQVGFYIEFSEDNKLYIITCEFEVNGNINIRFHHNNAMNPENIENIIKKAINEPILNKIKNFLEQSGYTFSLFNSLSDPNIEFKDISFISQITIKKNIKIKSYIGCLSTIFTVLKDTIKKRDGEITMKYKRVSNYNEMDSIESFITDQRKKDENPDDIIQDIVSNFNITTEQAKQRFAKWASEVNVETDLFENKKITIRTNTGFPITIKQDKSNFLTTIKTTEINDIRYIYHIFIFMDSLIRLIYDKDTTEVSNLIGNLCSGKKAIDVPDTTEEEDIKQTEIKFVDEGKQQAFLGLFGATNQGDEFADDDDDDIDFGDVQFGELDDVNEWDENSETKQKNESKVQEADDEFDFGDIQFDEMKIGETPNIDDEGKISKKEKPSLPVLENANEEENDISPLSDTSSSIDVDLTGLRLEGNNNIFMKRREELQPKLFLKKKKGRYKAYSTACPSQYAKQPLILTNSEKKYIDERDKDFGTQSYDEHITYGTGDTKYHYICPRFWCLSDENGKSRSISFDEINSGKCGGWDALIPEGSNKVPEGGRIVQFTDKRFHKKGVNTKNIMVYKPFYPSFMGKDKHPDGLCIPCCFGKPTTIGKGDWVERKDSKGKIYYENLKTGDSARKPPKIEYDTMYEPVGEGPGGPGPEFKRDQNGNIIMSSIVGKKFVRDKPAPSRLKSYNTCNQNVNKDTEKNAETSNNDEGIQTNGTIKSDEAPLLETFPHKFNQLGYLPLAVQKFIGYNSSKKCQVSLSDTKLKMDNFCLLQKGVQSSDNQSFLSCIADVFTFIENYRNEQDISPENLKTKPDITIEQLKNIIKERLNFDIFVTLQNGDLIEIFNNERDDVNVDDFKSSKFYYSLTNSKTNIDTDEYFKKCVTSYKNFIDYILDNNVDINYEYLWDFLSLKREDNLGGMFSSGMNLIILNSPDDDITSKLELICPTSMYTSNLYNIEKPILILYSKNGYYEPIYSFNKIHKNTYKIRKLFNIQEVNNDIPELSKILSVMWDTINKKCVPLFSMPEVYNKNKEFVNNISPMSVITYLGRSNSIYNLKTQIVNYNTKVVGLLLAKNDDDSDQIYIPCFPSAIIQDLPYEFIGRNNIWSSKDKTIEKLKYIYTVSKKNIPSNPRIIAVNDNIVIGIITETNQFIPVIPEVYRPSKFDEGLKIIQYNNVDMNAIEIDQINLLKNKVDIERIVKIKKIKLESYFYDAFRNLIRIIFTKPENLEIKKQLLSLINNITISYLEKLNIVNQQLREIMDKYLDFTVFNIRNLMDVKNIEQCLTKDNKKCNSKEYCVYSTNDNICKMLFPKVNLINDSDNEGQYFIRISDELIKFERIKTFIFKPRAFLSFKEITYSLNDDEIILLEDILYGDYFVDLIPQTKNKYIHSKDTWNTVEPATSEKYVNTFNMDALSKDKSINSCIITDKDAKKLSLGSLADKELSDYKLVEYKNSINCSWELFKEILNLHTKQNYSVQDIVIQLVEIYNSLMEDNSEKVVKIMKAQKKKSQSESIQNGTPIDVIITTTNYYLTAIDLCLLSFHYDLPLILLSRSKISTIGGKFISFIKNIEQTDICYIVYSGASYTSDSSKSPSYAIVEKDEIIQLSTVILGYYYNKITSNNYNDLTRYLNDAIINIGKEKRVFKVRIKKGKKKIKIKSKK
jgi:hypothetical protein